MARSTKTGKGKRRSAKGALLKGMSRRLPVQILENPVFRQELDKIMHRYAGIYALYRGKRLYYVGLTTRSLLWRVKGHTRDRHAGKWDHFVIFRIHRVGYLKDIETLIHQLVNTSGNKVKGKVPRDADINRILRAVLVEHEHVMSDLKRALR